MDFVHPLVDPVASSTGSVKQKTPDQFRCNIQFILKEALNSCVKLGFRGHGYSSNNSLIRNMEWLCRCEADIFVDKYGEISPVFSRAFRREKALVNRLALSNDNNSFETYNKKLAADISLTFKHRGNQRFEEYRKSIGNRIVYDEISLK